MQSEFYKIDETDNIWLVEQEDMGEWLFSFDKKIVYNFWTDFEKLTPEQKEIFAKDYPTMAKLKGYPISNTDEQDSD